MVYFELIRTEVKRLKSKVALEYPALMTTMLLNVESRKNLRNMWFY